MAVKKNALAKLKTPTARAVRAKVVVQLRQKVEHPQEVVGLVISGRPPSTNNVYRRSSGRSGMYMTDKGKTYKQAVINMLYAKKLKLPENTPLRVEIVYWCAYGQAYEEAQINKFDADGSHKILIDAIFEAANTVAGSDRYNDKWIWECHFQKRYMLSPWAVPALNHKHPRGYTTIRVRTMTEDEL